MWSNKMDIGNNSSVDAFASVLCMVYFVLLVKSFLCISRTEQNRAKLYLSTSLVLFVRYRGLWSTYRIHNPKS